MSAPTQDSETLAQTGYEAYAAQTGGKTFDGRDMPTWDALPDRIRAAWSAAAAEIAARVIVEGTRGDS